MRRHLISRSAGPRRGSVAPLTVLSLALFIGMIALVVDGGTLMEERRHVQAAADAAALAAAADLLVNYGANNGFDPQGTAAASAWATAAANGFSNDGAQSVVTVDVSPQSYQGGPNAGTTLPRGYVEIIIQYNAGRTFSGIFGSGTIPIRARAVARGQWAPVSNTVVLLNLTASSVLSASGSASLLVNGGLQVNSSSPSAFNLSGKASVAASALNLNSAAGTLSPSLSSFLLESGGTQPNYGGPMPDPLRYLPAPDPVQLGLTTQSMSGGSPVNLYPGVYNGGISVGGNTTVILHTNADGTPGIYYLQGGGLNVSGTATVTTASGEAGVMIYNNWLGGGGGGITVSGGSNLTLVPPASGPYQGVSLFQARGSPTISAPPLSITGSGSINVTGTVYAAYAKVSLSGSSGANVMGGQIIADTLSLSGRASISIDRGSQPVANTRLFGMVE